LDNALSELEDEREKLEGKANEAETRFRHLQGNAASRIEMFSGELDRAHAQLREMDHQYAEATKDVVRFSMEKSQLERNVFELEGRLRGERDEPKAQQES
jgi:chromosome segregation ATPase